MYMESKTLTVKLLFKNACVNFNETITFWILIVVHESYFHSSSSTDAKPMNGAAAAAATTSVTASRTAAVDRLATQSPSIYFVTNTISLRRTVNETSFEPYMPMISLRCWLSVA